MPMIRTYTRPYWRAVAEICGMPRWVWEFGHTPAARAVLATLAEHPQTQNDLADTLGYSAGTIQPTLSALKALGKVTHINNVWRLSERNEL